jgi:hypothetical protein
LSGHFTLNFRKENNNIINWDNGPLTYSKIKFASLEILTAPRLPDNLQFLNIRVLKDVRLLMKANEELPFTISPTILVIVFRTSVILTSLTF